MRGILLSEFFQYATILDFNFLDPFVFGKSVIFRLQLRFLAIVYDPVIRFHNLLIH